MNKIISIRTKLNVTIISIVIMTFLTLAVPFFTIYKSYYVNQQQDFLVNVYGSIEFNVSDISSIIQQAYLYELKENVNFIIINDTTDEIVYTTNSLNNGEDLNYSNLYYFEEKVFMDKKQKAFKIDKVVSRLSNDENLHLITKRNLNDTIYSIIIEKSIANIDESILSIVSFLFIFMIPISIVSSLLISKVSDFFIFPIIELSEKSKRMGKFDFSDDINIKTNDEIEILGENMKILSKELEKQLNELNNRNDILNENLAMKDKIVKIQREFTSNVSHELRTPITLILGYAEAVQFITDEESKKEYLDIIVKESYKMNNLITELLDISRLQSGDKEIQFSEFDVIEMIDYMNSKYQLIFKEKNIIYTSDVPTNQLLVYGDKPKLELVLTNYFTNAIRYVDDKKIIKLSVREEKNKVFVEIFNTSPKIEDEHINEIWGSFYKIDKARTRDKGGIGIGLYLVKTIMDLHGYEYGVRNVEDGVLFYFTINKENTLKK